MAFGVGLTWFLADRARGGIEHSSTAGIVYALGVGVAFSAVAEALYGAFRAGSALVGHVTAGPPLRLIVASSSGVHIGNEPITPKYV